jgi:cysteine synthase
MAEQFSVERRKLMRMLGAKVILTPKAGKGIGMIKKATELAELNGWFYCRQFETDANWKFHEATTGPEILNDLNSIGKPLDYFVTGKFMVIYIYIYIYICACVCVCVNRLGEVTRFLPNRSNANTISQTRISCCALCCRVLLTIGYGTGGTFHGAGKYIKSKSPSTKIILAEPGSAALIDSGIKTKRKDDGSSLDSHPAFKGHPIQGWTPDFIALVLEKGLNLGLMDERISVPDDGGTKISIELARTEGILTGISGGATVWAAIETARKAPTGSVIVCMLPDTGERYLSTPLFASIEAGMNKEEKEIAESTPSNLFH